jgi:ribokinase
MSAGNIAVIGSSNTDMVVKTTRLPIPGETILGGKFLMNPGGKGANQAVAAARLGGNVIFVGKSGEDIFGSQTRKILEKESIKTDFFLTDRDTPSGVALITVDNRGENCIVVAPGSNLSLTESDVSLAREEILSSDIILMQLEIPLETVIYASDMGFKAGKKVILNPAPAVALPDDLFRKLYLLSPNETEAELLTGIRVNDVESAEQAAAELLSKGTGIVIITLGSRGALVCMKNECRLIPAEKVEVVDTTAAGDVFNGALAVALSEGTDIFRAVEFAVRAATLSVTRMGAQASAPYLWELK